VTHARLGFLAADSPLPPQRAEQGQSLSDVPADTACPQLRGHGGPYAAEIVFHDLLSLSELTRPISAVGSLRWREVGARYLFHRLVCLTFNWHRI